MESRNSSPRDLNEPDDSFRPPAHARRPQRGGMGSFEGHAKTPNDGSNAAQQIPNPPSDLYSSSHRVPTAPVSMYSSYQVIAAPGHPAPDQRISRPVAAGGRNHPTSLANAREGESWWTPPGSEREREMSDAEIGQPPMKPVFGDLQQDGLPEISETSTGANELSTALDTARTACSSTESTHGQMFDTEKVQPKRSLSVILNEAAAELDRKIQRIRAQNPKLAERDSNPFNYSESSLQRPRMFDEIVVPDKLPTQPVLRNELTKPSLPRKPAEQDGLQPFTCDVPCSTTFDEHHSSSQDRTADAEKSNFHSPDTLFYRYSPQTVIPMEEEALTLGQLQSADSAMIDESARNMTSAPLTRRISLLKDGSDLSLGAQEPPVNPGIRVEIVESRRLPARRNGVVPDPFCSVSLHHYSGSYDGITGSQQVQVGSLGDIGMKAHLIRPQHRTRTVSHSLTPGWSDAVTLDDAYSSCVEQEDGVQLERAFLTKLSWQPVLLVVTVHDDGVKNKEVLGQVVLRVAPGASLAQWFSLQRRDGLPQYNYEGEMAEILLRIRSFSRGLDGTRSATLERVRLEPSVLNRPRPDHRRPSVSSKQLPLVTRLQALLRRTIVSRWYASMLVRFGGIFSRLPLSLEIQSDVRKPQALNDNYVETDLKLAAFWNARSPPPGFLPSDPGPSLHFPSLSLPSSALSPPASSRHSHAKPPLSIPRSPSPILPNGSLSPQPLLAVRSPSEIGDFHPSALLRDPQPAEDHGEPEGSWWWDGEQPSLQNVGNDKERAAKDVSKSEAFGGTGVAGKRLLEAEAFVGLAAELEDHGYKEQARRYVEDSWRLLLGLTTEDRETSRCQQLLKRLTALSSSKEGQAAASFNPPPSPPKFVPQPQPQPRRDRRDDGSVGEHSPSHGQPWPPKTPPGSPLGHLRKEEEKERGGSSSPRPSPQPLRGAHRKFEAVWDWGPGGMAAQTPSPTGQLHPEQNRPHRSEAYHKDVLPDETAAAAWQSVEIAGEEGWQRAGEGGGKENMIPAGREEAYSEGQRGREKVLLYGEVRRLSTKQAAAAVREQLGEPAWRKGTKEGENGEDGETKRGRGREEEEAAIETARRERRGREGRCYGDRTSGAYQTNSQSPERRSDRRQDHRTERVEAADRRSEPRRQTETVEAHREGGDAMKAETDGDSPINMDTLQTLRAKLLPRRRGTSQSPSSSPLAFHDHRPAPSPELWKYGANRRRAMSHSPSPQVRASPLNMDPWFSSQGEHPPSVPPTRRKHAGEQADFGTHESGDRIRSLELRIQALDGHRPVSPSF